MCAHQRVRCAHGSRLSLAVLDVWKSLRFVRRGPGSDIARFDNVTPNRCISECLANSSCEAYTHVPQIVIGGAGTCFLKSGVGGGGNTAIQMISASKAATGACNLSDGFCRL
jgi:hypothetical protein